MSNRIVFNLIIVVFIVLNYTSINIRRVVKIQNAFCTSNSFNIAVSILHFTIFVLHDQDYLHNLP